MKFYVIIYSFLSKICTNLTPFSNIKERRFRMDPPALERDLKCVCTKGNSKLFNMFLFNLPSHFCKYYTSHFKNSIFLDFLKEMLISLPPLQLACIKLDPLICIYGKLHASCPWKVESIFYLHLSKWGIWLGLFCNLSKQMKTSLIYHQYIWVMDIKGKLKN